ncbi:Mce-associated membrane protein [Streptomyces sp. 3212.3]|nr:Mce-associated membrane protein [Streptomyces sp. 3212.3]
MRRDTMANPTSRTRGTGSPSRRTMTAAARAAAKRAGRPARPEHGAREEERTPSGRTLLVEPPANGWEDPPEPESPESFEGDPEDGALPRRTGRRVLTAVLGAVLVAALAAAAVLGWQYRQEGQAEQARDEALAAARKASPVVLSYDYRHLDRDFSRARALLTGHFRDQYGRTTKAVVAPTATKYHGVVKATVATPADGGAPAASVVSAAPDRAVVLLFVNQVTRSTQVPQPRLDLNRVRMTLTRTSDGWKVSGVDAL